MRKIILIILLFVWVAMPAAHAQRRGAKKRQAQLQEQEGFSPYAYETEATTKRKTRGKSFSGKEEDSYAVERPVAPTEIGRNNRGFDYSKGPYFGHLRPVIRRPPGKQKLCGECGMVH